MNAAENLDLITLEIISHKIWQITAEMGVVLERASGSPVVFEVKDYMTALFDSQGNALMVGAGIVFHGASTVDAVRYINKNYSEDPGINDGDVFIANDPYVAAAHQPDIAVITPIFYEGELIAWSASCAHVADTGGIDPGGMCPRATEVFHEGLRTAGLKIIEKGKIKKDVWDTLLNMVCDPGGVGLDIKAEIAAGSTAKQRISELVGEFGLDSFKMICRQIIENSEKKLRNRLAKLPDGTWRAIQYLDNDGMGKIKKVNLEMTKEGNKIVFDFTGTGEQSPTNRNSSLAVSRGGVFGALAPMLCYDIDWNQGILNVMEVIIPEGTILNPKPPAALSEGPIGPAYLAHNATCVVLAEMLNTSYEYKDEASGLWTPSVSTQSCGAVNQYGHFIATIFGEIQAGGGGGRPWADGVDSGGIMWQPLSTMPNSEVYESFLPVLYLFRRQTKDSGGPGKFRGGVGGEYAIILHDAPTGEAILPPYGCLGLEAAIGVGISGGYPGAFKQYKMVRNSDIEEWISEKNELPNKPEDLKGDVELLDTTQVWHMKTGEILYQNWFGGGGYGDPLERDPELVLKDVTNGLVSNRRAEGIYGVVISPDYQSLDIERTTALRKQIRENRLREAK
jgi:N-methylhydantoinase B